MALTAAELQILITARDDASKALDAVTKKTQGLESTFSTVGASLTSVGKGLTLGVTAPIVGIGTAAAKMAGDFESQMNILTVAARSSGTALDDLSDAALSVGADTELVGITAAQSADAMTSLYKAGFDTAEIFGGAGGLNSYLNENASLTGALRSSIDLAAASELDLAQATDVTIIAMKTFGLDADEASRVANSFVRTADASVASVGDLAAAMANIGPTAATFGMSLETTNTALGILSSRGIAGAEAGTALKSMLTNMMRTTDDVTAAWNMLGIKMYDTEGKMRAMPDILGELSEALKVGNVLTSERALLTDAEIAQLGKLEERRAELAAKDLAIRNGTLLGNATLKEREAELKKVDKALQETVFEMEGLKAKEGQTITVTTQMTEELRNQTVQTLAGTYGMKAMNTLLTEGATGWDAMGTAIGAAASVEESAAARTTGFNAAMEQLGGALETIAITAGGPIITSLTALLQGPVTGLLDKISNLNPAVWDWALKIGLVVAAVGPLLLVLGTLLTTVGSVITIVTTLAPLFAGVGAAIGALVGPVLLVIAAIALLAAAWMNDWGGIRTFMTAFWNDTLKPIVDQIILWFQTNIPVAIAALAGFWTNTLLPAIQAVGNWITGTLIPVLQQVRDWLATNIPAAISAVSGFWTGTLLPAIQAVANWITGSLVPVLQTIWDWLSTTIPAAISTVSGFWTDTLLPAIRAVVDWINTYLVPLFVAIADVYLAAWDLALTVVAGLWENVLLPALKEVAKWLDEKVVPALESVTEWLGDKLQIALEAVGGFIDDTVVPAVKTLTEWFADKLVPAVKDLAEKVDGPLKSALAWLHDKLLIPVRTALSTLGDKIKDVTGFFQGLADKLNGLKDKLPSWLTPGSPTPLELGLDGIAESMVDVVQQFIKFGATLKGANLDNLSRFGLAVRDVAKTLKDLASAMHQMNKIEKVEGGIPDLVLWAAALKESIIRFSKAITEAAKEVKTSTINNARELSKSVEIIFELLKTFAETLQALNTIVDIPDMAPFGAALKQAIIITASAINEAAVTLGEKALRAAAKLSADCQDILALVGPAVTAIAALAELTLEQLAGAEGKWAGVQAQIVGIVTSLATIAAQLDMSGYPAAVTFSEAAVKILALIGPAVSALSSLATITVEEMRAAGENWSWLATEIIYIVQNLAIIAVQLDASGYPAAVTFAEAAGKIVTMIGPSVAGLTALAATTAEEMRTAGMNWSWLVTEVIYIVQNLATIAQQLDMSGYPEAILFSESAGKIITIIKPAIEALVALAAYSAQVGLTAAMEAFRLDIIAMVGKLTEIAAQAGPISEDAVAFSTAVAAAVQYIEPAIDAMVSLAAYTAAVGLTEAMTAFEADLTAVVTKLGEIAVNLSGDAGVGKAQAFSVAATAIKTAIEAGLSALSGIAGGTASSAAGALVSFAATAQTAMGDAVEAIKRGAEDIIAAIAPVPGGIWDVFASFNWNDIGYQLAKGIAAGITAGKSSIINAAVAAAKAGLQAAKDTLGIASPSRVAREEVGQMWGEGVALGIRDMMGTIRDAMANMAATPRLSYVGAPAGAATRMAATEARVRESVNYALTYVDQRPNGGPPDMLDVAERLEWRARMRR